MTQGPEIDLVPLIEAACRAARADVIARARFHNSPIVVCRDGQIVELDPFTLEIASPQQPASPGKTDGGSWLPGRTFAAGEPHADST